MAVWYIRRLSTVTGFSFLNAHNARYFAAGFGFRRALSRSQPFGFRQSTPSDSVCKSSDDSRQFLLTIIPLGTTPGAVLSFQCQPFLATFYRKCLGLVWGATIYLSENISVSVPNPSSPHTSLKSSSTKSFRVSGLGHLLIGEFHDTSIIHTLF